MSQANLPNITPDITLSRTESLDLIIASIALEELALAHILNAEAEKIQYVLGTLPGLSPAATISNVLAVNESVNCVLQSATQKQMYLQNKLKQVLQAPSLTGPTGSTGAMGPTGPTGICTCCPTGGLFRYREPNSISVQQDQNLPLNQTITEVTTPGAFVLNPDGTVTVNETGTYRIEARVQTDNASSYCIYVNGILAGGFNGGAVSAPTGGTIIIPAIIDVNAGDRVSINNCAINGAVGELTDAVNGRLSAQGVLRIEQIPCTF